MNQWHQLQAEDVLRRLASDASGGLSETESRRRLVQYGPNELQVDHRVLPWTILLAQCRNILVLILLFAVTLSGFLGHTFEAGAIAVIVLFAVFLGFYQEYRAEARQPGIRLFIQPRYGMAAVGDHPTIDPVEKASAFSQQPAYLLTSKGVIL